MKVSFFCKNCQLDYDTDKVAMSTAYGGIEKFNAHCPKCGRVNYRLTGSPQSDPYYYESRNVIINRQKFGKDLLQPNDYGFRTYYKQEYEKIQKAKEEFGKKEQIEKKRRTEFYKNSLDKGLAKKIIEGEEKINGGT